MAENLLRLTEAGLFCPLGDFYIDPSRRVKNAVVTHAHSDHAGRGHSHYLAARGNENILKHRLGKNISVQQIPFGEKLDVSGVKVSFHPAAHIWGSAQVRLEHKGVVWVVTGDYKLENDGFSGEFEPVKCQTFITECTFGLPIYQWKKQQHVYDEIQVWRRKNEDRVNIIRAYSLGKAQRLIHGLGRDLRLFVDENIWKTNQALKMDGAVLPKVERLNSVRNLELLKGQIVLMSSVNDLIGRLPEGVGYEVADASGWMQVSKTRYGRGFVLSDHADWSSLNMAVKETGATCVFATHGFDDHFARWLNSQGFTSYNLKSLNTINNRNK